MRFIETLKGHKTDRAPFWFMRQAGRYLSEYREIRSNVKNFLELCYTPELATEVTIQPIRRYSMDAAILFSDILVIPDALGQSVQFVEGEGPRLEALDSKQDLLKLNQNGILDHLAPVFETVENVRSQLDSKTALIGFCGAPWTVATYMIEGSGSKNFFRAKQWAYHKPKDFQFLMDILVESSIRYLNAQIAAGADAVQIFDSWAGALDQDGFNRWVIEPNRRIVEGVRKENPDTPIIGFAKGAGVNTPDFAAKTGINCAGLDASMSVSWARDNVACSLQGNLDPARLLCGGDAMIMAAEKIIEDMGDKPFVFNLGHGIDKTTPPEHVEQLCDFLKNA